MQKGVFKKKKEGNRGCIEGIGLKREEEEKKKREKRKKRGKREEKEREKKEKKGEGKKKEKEEKKREYNNEGTYKQIFLRIGKEKTVLRKQDGFGNIRIIVQNGMSMEGYKK